MRRSLFVLALFLLAGALLVAGSPAPVAASPEMGGHVVIANRGSGTISVLDADTFDVEAEVTLPGVMPQPMYVVYNQIRDLVFVGDRTNDQVVVFDADDFSMVATVPAGAGVFHMWADIHGRQLWVNNDIDKTATVIDTRSLKILATVPMPADLVADGGKPHDVIVDREGRFAYVTMLGLSGPNDYVVKFSTKTFEEVGRAAVGKDPHLALTQRNHNLYVPAQNSNMVSVLDRRTLEPISEISVPAAHGAGMRRDGRFLYTTNIAGGGTDGLVAIDTRTNEVLGATDTPYPTPHNIALTPKGERIFVTHSGGTADQVSVYGASNGSPVPTLLGTVSVGLNPFGLAYVP